MEIKYHREDQYQIEGSHALRLQEVTAEERSIAYRHADGKQHLSMWDSMGEFMCFHSNVRKLYLHAGFLISLSSFKKLLFNNILLGLYPKEIMEKWKRLYS